LEDVHFESNEVVFSQV